MDDDRSDAMTGAAFERAIETALAVDPSPEFLARVRLRIEGEPGSSMWRMPWMLTAGALAVAIVMAVVVFRSDRKPTLTSTDQVAVARRTATETAPPPVPSTASATPRTDGTPAARPAREARPARDPEVLISADEAAGLRRLISVARDGRIDFTPVLIANREAAVSLQPFSEITWEPITVEPLEPNTTEEGVRQ